MAEDLHIPTPFSSQSKFNIVSMVTGTFNIVPMVTGTFNIVPMVMGTFNIVPMVMGTFNIVPIVNDQNVSQTQATHQHCHNVRN